MQNVVLPGFEPGQTGPESVVLPLHHRTRTILKTKMKTVKLVLFYQDSNLDKQDQNLLCYHYTIEQF